MTSSLPRGSEKCDSDEINYQQNVDKDLYSNDPIVLSAMIVGNYTKTKMKDSMYTVKDKVIFNSDDDITVLLKRLESISEKYTILSQKYLSISDKVLTKLRELSENLKQGSTLRIYCDVEDSGSIGKLYDNLNSYVTEAQEVVERIRLLMSNSDNVENYKDQVNEILKLWDSSRDQLKGIGGKNTYSEHYIVTEMVTEFSNIDAQLFDSKKDCKRNIDEFLHSIKGKLSFSKESLQEIASKFLDSINSLIESWKEVLHPLRSKHKFDLSSQYSNCDDNVGVYLRFLDGSNPKSELKSTDTETTFSINDTRAKL